MANTTTYRCFSITETAELFTITEIAPTTSHPMNWNGWSEATRENAWAFAQARGKHTVFVGQDGSVKDCGVPFSPQQFEQAAYRGHVAYGCSMTDGYYAPESFETWVKVLRQHPAEVIANHNDSPESVKAALPKYLEALASLGA
jgi:hypothetical protein